MRKLRSVVAIAAAFALVAGAASAQQVYTWKDANGVTHFAQTPPPSSSTHYSKVNLTAGAEVSSNPTPTSAPASSAPAPANVAQKPQEAGGTQPDTAANRAKFCTQLNNNIALLQGDNPVVSTGTDGKGKPAVLSDAARQQQIATQRAQQQQFCRSSGT